jgi:metal-responsive CopG/Arc/MetJ family transcriptional regulator
MWYLSYMGAKPVQISLDGELLRRIDRDPEAKKLGRSAFVRNAVSAYLQAKERRDIDAAIRKAYRATADDLVDEVEDLLRAQAWPES